MKIRLPKMMNEESGYLGRIETPRGRASGESDSVKDFFIVLFAYPAAEPTGNALTGIQV